MEFRADLHCHSTCSDGAFEPLELVMLAKKVGLSALSITDHDSFDAYTPALITHAQKEGIQLLTGVEFSASFRGNSVHILGYGCSLNTEEPNTALALCEEHKGRRERRILAILDKLRLLGIPILEKEVKEVAGPQGSIGRPHIAEVLLRRGYISSIHEGFSRFLKPGKCAYVPGEEPTVAKTVRAIHGAGGLAFLAHPHLIKEARILTSLLEEMDVQGETFDGIECYYSRYPYDVAEKWVHLCKERGWLWSGGSDFHRQEKGQELLLGASWIDEEAYDKICNGFHGSNCRR